MHWHQKNTNEIINELGSSAQGISSEEALKRLGEHGSNELKAMAALKKMAAEGLRVLCIGMKKWDMLPDDMSYENAESEITILGLAGMIDPPRKEAKEAVDMCKTAGIRPVMITGDHPITAMAIAERLGIVEAGSKAVITGRELSIQIWQR